MNDFPTEAMEVMEDIDQQGYMINLVFIWRALEGQRLYEYTSNLQDILRVIEELKRVKEEENRERYPVYRKDRSYFVESSFRLVSISKANKAASLIDHTTSRVGFSGNSDTNNKIDKVLIPSIGGFPTSHFPFEFVVDSPPLNKYWTTSYQRRSEWLDQKAILGTCFYFAYHAKAGDNKFYFAKLEKTSQTVFILHNRRNNRFGWWFQEEADAYTTFPPRKFDSEEKMIDDLSLATGLPTYEELRDGTWIRRL